MTTDEILHRKSAAIKANATAADELAIAICELEGGAAEVERTAERYEIFRWVWSQPSFDKAARRAIWSS
jgi:uncharacterized membrane-anchored protein